MMKGIIPDWAAEYEGLQVDEMDDDMDMDEDLFEKDIDNE